jgi:hypothetical protein
MNGYHAETEVCAGDLSLAQSPCYGDSGGPLFVRDGGGAPLLVGVVSRGLACGVVPTHSVYARVGAPPLRTWIESKLPSQVAPAPAPPPSPAVAAPAPAAQENAPAIRFARTRSCRGERRLEVTAELPPARRGSLVVRFGRRTALRRQVVGTRQVVARRAPARAFTATVSLRVDDGTGVTRSRRYGPCRRPRSR